MNGTSPSGRTGVPHRPEVWHETERRPGHRRRAPDRDWIEDLRRRVLCRWMISYVAMAWIVLQLLDVLADIWALPLRAQQVVTLILGFGILPSVLLAWYHDDERRTVTRTELMLVALITTGSALVMWATLMRI